MEGNRKHSATIIAHSLLVWGFHVNFHFCCVNLYGLLFFLSAKFEVLTRRVAEDSGLLRCHAVRLG